MTATTDTTIRPFTIDIPQERLDDLRTRLAQTRLPDIAPGITDAYGVPDAWVRDLLDRWQHGFDWREWEAKLNAYPQFMTEIDGQPVHFFHIRSQEPNAMPLVLLHGWPGGVIEFLELIGPLTDPVAHGGKAEDAFHLVIPAGPGYGFSSPLASASRTTTASAARNAAELMRRLGYERYGAQGGDWGAFVAPELGRSDAQHVIGVHVNAASFGFIPLGELSEEEQAELTQAEKVRYARLRNWEDNLSGYFKIQSTRPQTLAYAMTDSPVGLAAWIGDWFRDRTIETDRVLANITIYWLTNTFASSILGYYENLHSGNWPAFSTTPTGVANFGDDIAIRKYAEQLNTIVHWSEFDEGNHFAAMSAPELLTQDVREFFGALR
ncbi:MAG TPA: epoxide hydrolase [Thermomicrobiales bacterium]|nr:epoxide hydrolase [Thermomicrobiales bacterium]